MALVLAIPGCMLLESRLNIRLDIGIYDDLPSFVAFSFCGKPLFEWPPNQSLSSQRFRKMVRFLSPPRAIQQPTKALQNRESAAKDRESPQRIGAQYFSKLNHYRRRMVK